MVPATVSGIAGVVMAAAIPDSMLGMAFPSALTLWFVPRASPWSFLDALFDTSVFRLICVIELLNENSVENARNITRLSGIGWRNTKSPVRNSVIGMTFSSLYLENSLGTMIPWPITSRTPMYRKKLPVSNCVNPNCLTR